MVTPSALVRAACWIASAGLHTVAFVAAGHPARSSANALRDPQELVAIDIEPPSVLEANELPAPPVAAKASSFLPPPTHTHPYPVPFDHDAHPHDPSLVHLPLVLPSPSLAEPVVAAPLAPARFAMIVASESPRGPVVANAAGDARPVGLKSEGDAPWSEESVSSPARLPTRLLPTYPPMAMAQGVEADVVIEVVVSAAGDVAAARILKPAGFGFDEAALDAVLAKRFIPAERKGRRVPVRMRLPVSFRLRN